MYVSVILQELRRSNILLYHQTGRGRIRRRAGVAAVEEVGTSQLRGGSNKLVMLVGGAGTLPGRL